MDLKLRRPKDLQSTIDFFFTDYRFAIIIIINIMNFQHTTAMILPIILGNNNKTTKQFTTPHQQGSNVNPQQQKQCYNKDHQLKTHFYTSFQHQIDLNS